MQEGPVEDLAEELVEELVQGPRGQHPRMLLLRLMQLLRRESE